MSEIGNRPSIMTGRGARPPEFEEVDLAVEKGERESDHVARRSANVRVLEDFMAAVGEADFSALESICQPDFVAELPYSDPPQRLDGFSAYRAAVLPSLEIFRFRLTPTKIYSLLDPDLLVAEYTGDGHAVPTGKPYRNVYIGVFRFREGRLAEIREFYNPELARLALTPDEPEQGP